VSEPDVLPLNEELGIAITANKAIHPSGFLAQSHCLISIPRS